MSDPVVVLLVEDEPLVRILLSELLTESGFRVVEAANAQEALTILGAELDVRVMLTDVDMPPGLNGYELARLVHERWPGVGILVTSGRQRPTDGDLPQEVVFLAKPMPNEVLVSYVKAAVERSTRAVEGRLRWRGRSFRSQGERKRIGLLMSEASDDVSHPRKLDHPEG